MRHPWQLFRRTLAGLALIATLGVAVLPEGQLPRVAGPCGRALCNCPVDIAPQSGSTNCQTCRGISKARSVLTLGASRGRIMRQMLTENLLLAATGGAAGYAVAHLAVHYFRRALPEQFSFGRFLIQMERIKMQGVLFGTLPFYRVVKPRRAFISYKLNKNAFGIDPITVPRAVGLPAG